MLHKIDWKLYFTDEILFVPSMADRDWPNIQKSKVCCSNMLLFSRNPCAYSSTLLPMSSLAFCQSDAVSMYWTTSCSVSLWANRVDPLWAYEFMSVSNEYGHMSFCVYKGWKISRLWQKMFPHLWSPMIKMSVNIFDIFHKLNVFLSQAKSSNLLFWCHAGMIPWI